MKSFWKIFGVVMLGIVILCSAIGFVLFGAAGIAEVINGLEAINTELAAGFILCLLSLGCYWIMCMCDNITTAIKTKME